MKMTYRKLLVSAGLLFSMFGLAHGQHAEYLGFRACTKCHDAQGDSWKISAHAKALDSLKPNTKADAKKLAKLDPSKDYTRDKNCLVCHVTGFELPGGYSLSASMEDTKTLAGVTCESCHGAGGKYRALHGEASDRLKNQSTTTDRKVLVEAGQVFDMESACNRCHLNYEGAPGYQAKPPYTPYTPSLGPKYQFDFKKSVMTSTEKNPVHTHYKLRNVFKGGPVPSVREKLQETAQEPE